MCGIAGIFDCHGRAPPAEASLRAMLVQLRHRGPDGDGIHIDGQLGLAHARLSILDLEGGAQPIHNEDRSVWVVFNGEIFNYIELRADLLQRGHRFYTESDTEVLVHLYEEYGDDFPRHLNGQFAIALWDARQRRLILVRDRVGILPLFYTIHGGSLIFASEIKAILPLLGTAPSLDPAALDQIFTCWAPLGTRTPFAGIKQVAPGGMLIVTADRIETRQYWEWRFPDGDGFLQGETEALAEELHGLLLDATRIRLRADVPVGAYLSGGLDSSALAALMAHCGANLRTFSVGFDNRELDERSHQNQMRKHLGAEHSEVLCREDDVGAILETVIAHTETPILRTGPAPMWMLSRLVRSSGYKVVLTGEGADEVFGGYDIFKEAKIRQFWAADPKSAMRPRLLQRLYPWLDFSPARAAAFSRDFFGADLNLPDAPDFSHLPRWRTTARCKEFFSQGLRDSLAGTSPMDDLMRPPASWHPFCRAQYLEATGLMPQYLLWSQGDRMLMANSVEGRFPYLDHRVIEFANRLPPRVKMRVLREKYLLKRAVARYLPDEIVNRFKQPYRSPDAPVFRTGTGAQLLRDVLHTDAVRRYGYFEPSKVALLVRKLEAGRALGFKDNMALIGMVTTQIWHRQFVENWRAAH
jgi:asparagine synthase (glutamine-hydrolysing)